MKPIPREFPAIQILCFSLTLLLQMSSSSITLAKLIPLRFPSSLITPEEPSINNGTHHENKTPCYETHYFTQTLDHFNFNPQSYDTFQQRYLISSINWGGPNTASPIFVYLGNEGDIQWFARNTGLMYEIAPRFKALLVFIEHRYYGKSIPYGGNKEVAFKNASTQGYLSSSQALADYATLILDLKKNLSALDSPVLVFGGSYGGMLAAWFRLKYPHVSMGALASSSPILAFDNITSPFAFNNVVAQDFRNESENCYTAIKKSWQQIKAVGNKPGGLDLLGAWFRVCKSESFSVESLTRWLTSAYVYAAVTDYPNPSNFMNPMPGYPVKEMCKAIDDDTGMTENDTFDKLYRAASIYYNYTGDVKECFQLDDDDSDDQASDAWSWQTCTELIMQTDGNDEESMFPASSPYDDEAQALNADPTTGSTLALTPLPPNSEATYCFLDIRRVLRRYASNIIFFNGLRDPWSSAGVLSSISGSLIAIVAEQGAHHVDLRFSTREDPDWLRQVRQKEARIIHKWLFQYYQDLPI